MSLPVTDGVLAAADLSGGGLPSYTHGQRDQLLHEAYRLHFIYNAAHKQPAASTTTSATTTTTIRSLAALPLFFEHYDATGAFLAVQGPPFAATDPCAADPVRLAAAADAFFAATLRFWHYPAVVARKAQLVAREAYLDDCPRVASTSTSSTSTSTSTTGSGPDGIIDDADITTVTVADMEAVQDALEQVSREAKEARSVVRRMDRFADPEVDHLLEALSDVGGNVREILEAVKEVEGIFVEGGFQ
ncbi:hypothetical protein BC567DRAFT_263963 [Phyllosticta citribraziliensis]